MPGAAGIAVCVEPESVDALAWGIERALALPKNNTVAREYAERTLEKENVLRQFIADISPENSAQPEHAHTQHGSLNFDGNGDKS